MGGNAVAVVDEVSRPTILQTAAMQAQRPGEIQAEGNVIISTDLQATPTFKEEWNEDFAAESFHPGAVRAICYIGTVCWPSNFISAIAGYDGAGGGQSWVLLTWMPNLICGAVYFLTALLFTLRSARPFCIRHYDLICAITIVAAYITIASSYLILEIRRAQYQNADFPHVVWGLNYKGFPPIRTCNDTDPVGTLEGQNHLSTDRGQSVGCNNLILSGGIYSFYVVFSMFPMVYNMSWRSTVVVALINSAILMFTVLSVGTKDWELFFAISFQFSTGLLAAFFCRARYLFDRQQFAVSKATKVAAEQNSNLLYTLIPKNVVNRLALHESVAMLGTTIPRCTIMFCSLEPQADIQEHFSEPVFDLLNEVFAAFDRAVKRFGMFKYQHVGDWYIVACPRAATPFDEDEQARPYPHEYTLAMVLLGNELRRIAQGYVFQGTTPLWLKVGINCGPVAGAVIGTLRSFYCIYGDAINTAARMCKYASQNHMHCSSEFAAALRECSAPDVPTAAAAAGVYPESRGLREIKGKGLIETFDIHVTKGKAADAHTKSEGGSQAAARPRLFLAAKKVISLREADIVSTSAEDLVIQRMRRPTSPPVPPPVANDPEHRLHPLWSIFCNPAQESQYLDDTADARRRGLLAGILLHVATVACSAYMVAKPQYSYDYTAHGDPELTAGRSAAMTVLMVHLGVSYGVSAALAAVACRDPLPRILCEFGLVVLKLVHVACAARSFADFPGDIGWGVIFVSDMAFLQGMAGLGVGAAVALVCGTLVEFVVAVAALRGAMAFSFVKAVVYLVGAVWLARIGGREQRVQWRWNHRLDEELGRLHDKLCDLLPPVIAQQMLAANRPAAGTAGRAVSRRGSGGSGELMPRAVPRACERCTVVVLQLDICGFTSMSQTLEPMTVAEIVHDLFSMFDHEVQARGLFKMDTVGDAYIVAGFLSAAAGSTAAALVHLHRRGSEVRMQGRESFSNGRATMRSVCEELLEVARVILESMQAYRHRTGRDVHCRIGVSAGPVVAGVLGQLQPRFHIFGEGLRSAEHHEQTGRIDTVHASPAFIRALRAAASVAAATAASATVNRSVRGQSRSISLQVAAAAEVAAAAVGIGRWTMSNGGSKHKVSEDPSASFLQDAQVLAAEAAAAAAVAGGDGCGDESLVVPFDASEPGAGQTTVAAPHRQLSKAWMDAAGSGRFEAVSRRGSVEAGGGEARSLPRTGSWASESSAATAHWLPAAWRFEAGPGDGCSLHLAAPDEQAGHTQLPVTSPVEAIWINAHASGKTVTPTDAATDSSALGAADGPGRVSPEGPSGPWTTSPTPPAWGATAGPGPQAEGDESFVEVLDGSEDADPDAASAMVL